MAETNDTRSLLLKAGVGAGVTLATGGITWLFHTVNLLLQRIIVLEMTVQYLSGDLIGPAPPIP